MEINKYYYNTRCKDRILQTVKELYPDPYQGFLWMTRYGIDKPIYFKIYRFNLSPQGKITNIFTWHNNKRVSLVKLPRTVFCDPTVISLIRERRNRKKKCRKAA